MKYFILLLLSIGLISAKLKIEETEKVKLFLNGKEVTERISAQAKGKLEVVLPEGWRFISGKVKILNGDEEIKVLQLDGDKGLEEADLLKFIKLNAVPGYTLHLVLSVRTTESSTFAKFRIPIVE